MLDKIIESLGSEPCYLAIVTAMIIAYLIIKNNNNHQQRMEEIRIAQLKKLNKGKN